MPFQCNQISPEKKKIIVKNTNKQTNKAHFCLICGANLAQDVACEGDQSVYHLLHPGGEALQEEALAPTAHRPHLRGDGVDGVVAHGPQQQPRQHVEGVQRRLAEPCYRRLRAATTTTTTIRITTTAQLQQQQTTIRMILTTTTY